MSDLEILLEEIEELRGLIGSLIYEARMMGDLPQLEKIFKALDQVVSEIL